MNRKSGIALVASLAMVAGLATALTATAAPATTVPSFADYKQCANGAPPSTSLACPSSWINGILQGSNSHYREDQVVPQRALVTVPVAGSGPSHKHSLTFRYFTRKDSANAHAYDSLTTWNWTQRQADRCADLPSKVTCPTTGPSTFIIPEDHTDVTPVGDGISTDTSVHSISASNTVQDDPNVPPGVMTMYGGTITNVTVPEHSNPDAGTGDDYATITVEYTTPTATKAQNVELLFGGHLAASAGDRGWGAGLGAANISGGPYHIKWDLIDGTSAGSKDNQIQAGAILATPAAFSLTKVSDAPAPPATVLPGATVQFTLTVQNTGQTAGVGVVTDTYQDGVTIVDPDGCSNDTATRTLTCTTGSLAAGATQSFVYTAKMPLTFPDDTNQNLSPCTTAGTFRVRNNATVTGGATAHEDVCVNAAPDFKPTKVNDAQGPVEAGALVNYTITIKNQGSASGSTTFTDDYADGVTITSLDPACTDNGAGTITCTTNTLAPGESQDFTYTARMPLTFPTSDGQGDGDCTDTQFLVVNTVTVKGKTTTSDVCVHAEPHFIPGKSVSPSTTIPGGTVTYTVTVTNDGKAPGVGSVVDVRQAGVTILTNPLPNGCVNTNATTITCTSTSTLAPGEFQSWSYDAQMPQSGTINVAGCGPTQFKVVNTATAGGTSVTAKVCVDTAQFVISKENNSPTGGVDPGANVDYTVTVSNTGSAAGSTSFTDVYPSGVVVNDSTLDAGCTDDIPNHTITCNTGSIAAHTSKDFTYTAKMPTSFPDTTNQGLDPCGDDQFRVRNTAKLTGATTGSTSDVCVNASPQFTKSKVANPTVASPGQTITYTVTVTNVGSAPGSTSFTDTPPAGVQILTYPNTCSLTAGTLTCSTGTLAPGGPNAPGSTATFVYTAKMPTSYTDTLGGSPCTNTQLKIVNHAVFEDNSEATSTVCVNEPVLHVNKSACTTNPIPNNGLLSYTITYSNSGSAPATNTVLTDTIPDGTTVADSGGGTPTTSGGHTTITWTIGTLAAGGSGSKTFTVGVGPTTTGPLVNTATITSTETSDTSNTVTNTVSNAGASASGRAYGIFASVLGLPVGPLPDATGNQSKSVASLNTSALSLGVLGASNTQSVTATQASDTAVASVADVGVNLIGLKVHADAIVARSQSTASGSTATSVTDGSEVLGLTINGKSIGDVSAPRVIFVVNLLGIKIAEVDVLEEVGRSGAALGGAAGAQPQNGFFNSGIGVNGLHVRLLNGTADVVVSHAESKAKFPTGTPCNGTGPFVIGGAVIADEFVASPIVQQVLVVNPIVLPSTGGDVVLPINALTLAPLGTAAATGKDESHGTLSPLQAHSSAEVQSAVLLGGAVKADVIKSTAAATSSSLSGSTTIVNLRIAGLPISVLANPSPNTVIIDVTRTLKLVVNEQIVGSGHVIAVNAIHLYVLGAGNPLGLPIGSSLIISGSVAGTS